MPSLFDPKHFSHQYKVNTYRRLNHSFHQDILMAVLLSIEVNFPLLSQTHMMTNLQTIGMKILERVNERTT